MGELIVRYWTALTKPDWLLTRDDREVLWLALVPLLVVLLIVLFHRVFDVERI